MCSISQIVQINDTSFYCKLQRAVRPVTLRHVLIHRNYIKLDSLQCSRVIRLYNITLTGECYYGDTHFVHTRDFLSFQMIFECERKNSSHNCIVFILFLVYQHSLRYILFEANYYFHCNTCSVEIYPKLFMIDK